jgi:hypothetical protein
VTFKLVLPSKKWGGGGGMKNKSINSTSRQVHDISDNV